MSKILVLIQLMGGNDSLNTIIPAAGLSEYHRKRPTIGLKDSDMLDIPHWDLKLSKHAEPILDLYNDGKVAIINGVGYANQNFSHFRSTDILMSAVPEEVNNTGWIGRTHDNLLLPLPTNHPPALKIGQGSSMLFQAGKEWGVSITSPEKFYQLIDDFEYPIPPTVWGPNLGYIRNMINKSQAYSDEIGKAYYNGWGQFDTEGYLADQLEIVCKLITGGLQTPIYHVTLDGFDTHALQFDTHNDLISQLANSVQAFMAAVDDSPHDITVMTFSEFGRRTFENESRGTDHGAASTQFIFGKNVNPGVYGNITGIEKDNLDMNFDFREVYADVLKWMGADSKQVLFGDYKSLDFLKSDTIVIPPPPDPKKERYRWLDLERGRKVTLFSDNTWEEGPIQ